MQLLFIPIAVFILLSCEHRSNEVVVREFIQADNDRDSIKMMNFLHDDFIELFEQDTTIASKKKYANHYAWGKEMNGKFEFEIKGSNSDTVKVLSKYYCQRDNILKLGPYESTRFYVIKNGQIFKIIEEHDEELYQTRDEVYMSFLNWLRSNKKLLLSDFPFSKEGAIRLKAVLNEYMDDPQK